MSKCKHHWGVIETRQAPTTPKLAKVLGKCIRRRKKCKKCGDKITTYESCVDPRQTITALFGTDPSDQLRMGAEHAMTYILNLFQHPSARSDKNRTDMAKWLITYHNTMSEPDEEDDQSSDVEDLKNVLSFVPGE